MNTVKNFLKGFGIGLLLISSAALLFSGIALLTTWVTSKFGIAGMFVVPILLFCVLLGSLSADVFKE